MEIKRAAQKLRAYLEPKSCFQYHSPVKGARTPGEMEGLVQRQRTNEMSLGVLVGPESKTVLKHKQTPKPHDDGTM
jgi:hypothetical protein